MLYFALPQGEVAENAEVSTLLLLYNTLFSVSFKFQ